MDVPLHVVAGEYADIMRQLGGSGTVRQAIEFFLHNAVRPDLVRTVSQVVGEFLASKTADGLSQVYRDDCAWRLRVFATDFQAPISHVCTRDIEEWLRKPSTGLATRNNFRRLISTLFNFARRRGYLPRDRETEARWLEKPKIKSKPIQIFSPGELRELLAVAGGQAELAIVIGAFTGIRSAEMLRLNWENFNWEEGVIDIHRAAAHAVDPVAAARVCAGSVADHDGVRAVAVNPVAERTGGRAVSMHGATA